MKVNVQLEFDSPEAAIAFLGRKVMEQEPKKPEVPVVRTPPGPRQPRADKGKPRGPYKKAEAPAKSSSVEAPQAAQAPESSAPEPAAQPAEDVSAEQPPASSVSVTEPAAAAPIPTEADVTAALQDVLNGKGMPAVTAIFEKYGVRRGRDVPIEKRAEFLVYCQEQA
jgi:hypothetical protein